MGTRVMSLRRSMVATAAANYAAPLASLATAPILARTLDVDGRGRLAAAVAPHFLALSVASFGLPESVTYHVASRRSSPFKALAIALCGLLVGGIVAAVSIVAASAPLSQGDADLRYFMIIGAAFTPSALAIAGLRGLAAGVAEWELVNREKYLTSSLRLSLIIFLFVTGRLTVFSAVLVILVVPIVASVVYLRLIRTFREGLEQTSNEISTPVRPILTYATRVWLGAAAGILLTRLDQVLLTPLADVRQLGLYAVAVGLGELPVQMSAAGRDVLISADAATNSDARVGSASRVLILATLAVAGLMGASTPLLLRWVFGPEFESATTATWVLLSVAVLGSPGSIAGAALTARGRPGIRSVAIACGALINLLLLLALVPRIGALGAALATLGGSGFAAALNIVALCRLSALTPRALLVPGRSDIAVLREGLRRVLTP